MREGGGKRVLWWLLLLLPGLTPPDWLATLPVVCFPPCCLSASHHAPYTLLYKPLTRSPATVCGTLTVCWCVCCRMLTASTCLD